MSTIPISQLVTINPGVLPAGGSAVAFTGMWLTENTRVPIAPLGQPLSFSSADDVLDFFGPGNEYNQATVYFAGFNNKTQTPGNLSFVQYPASPVSAYLWGGDVSGLSIPQLQAIDGTMTVSMDGYSYSGSVNLSSATSFTAAASTIQTALNGSLPGGGSFTGTVTAETFVCTASIAGNVMYVTAVASGILQPGAPITGANVAANTVIGSQITSTAAGGALGGIGTYSVNISQVAASATVDGTYGLLTITAVSSGTLAVGQVASGTEVASGSIITALGNGTGGDGTYILNLTATATSTTITATAPPLAVSYDSVSGAFVIQSGSTGAVSVAAYPTTSGRTTMLGLTQATGATLSQGAAATTPAALMNAVTAITQNWATFLTLFDPDGGSGFTQKLASAAWNNGQNNRYLYVAWDTSILGTEAAPSTSSFGYALQQGDYSGTSLNYEPSDLSIAAFVSGMAASINFGTPGGRITAAYKSQTGLTAGVTNGATAINLAGNPQVLGSFGNGYNFYGAYGNANASGVFYQRGTVSGPYAWFDTYVNQIWLNSSFLVSTVAWLQIINSVPYNESGYAEFEQVLQPDIDAAVSAGVIVAGVTLSASQILDVNTAAGANVAPIIQSVGWYLQVSDPGPAARASRQSPAATFWYCDGGSIQAINLASLVLQ